MKTKKQNFKINYGIACANNDRYRPKFNLVHFKGGNIFATDAHLLIKCPLDLHPISNKEILDGKFIHKDTFAKIIKYHTAIPQEDGVLCYDNKGREVALYLYSKDVERSPDFDKVIGDTLLRPSSQKDVLNFDWTLLAKVGRLLINPNNNNALQIESKDDLCTIIKPNSREFEEQICLVMGVNDYY